LKTKLQRAFYAPFPATVNGVYLRRNKSGGKLILVAKRRSQPLEGLEKPPPAVHINQ